MAVVKSVNAARFKRGLSVPETSFMQFDAGVIPIVHTDIGSDGAGDEVIQKWVEHTADGIGPAAGRALNGEEGLISRNWMPRYRQLEPFMRNVCGIPVTDVSIESGARRKIVWRYPDFGPPSIETRCWWYGSETSYWGQFRGGKVRSFNLDVVRNGDGGDLTGNVEHHFNWVDRIASLTAGLPTDEVQRMNFNLVPGLQKLAFRKTGTLPISAVFYASDSNATLKALLEALYGGTITVAGNFTTSTDPDFPGVTFYSGTKTITFSGALSATSVPQVEVVSGEVHSFLVGAGATTGTLGGAAFTVGNSAATLQGNLQAQGGVMANVVVAGQSS